MSQRDEKFEAAKAAYAEAKAALLKAQAAAPRPERPLADQGRQAEIRERLTKLTNG